MRWEGKGAVWAEVGGDWQYSIFLARRGRRYAFILFCINSVIQIQAVCSFSLCEYCISRKGNKIIRQVRK